MKYIKEHSEFYLKEYIIKYIEGYFDSFIKSCEWVKDFYPSNRIGHMLNITGDILFDDSVFPLRFSTIDKKEDIEKEFFKDNIIRASLNSDLKFKLENMKLKFGLNVLRDNDSEWFDIQNKKRINVKLSDKEKLIDKLTEIYEKHKGSVKIQIDRAFDAFFLEREIYLNIDEMIDMVKNINK